MGWLVCDDRVLATLEVAESRRARMRGIIGREEIDGALLIRPANSIHTFGVKFAIDVAYCDAELRVLEVVAMPPNRVGRPRPRAKAVIEANARSFERWGICVGDQLEVRQ